MNSLIKAATIAVPGNFAYFVTTILPFLIAEHGTQDGHANNSRGGAFPVNSAATRQRAAAGVNTWQPRGHPSTKGMGKGSKNRALKCEDSFRVTVSEAYRTAGGSFLSLQLDVPWTPIWKSELGSATSTNGTEKGHGKGGKKGKGHDSPAAEREIRGIHRGDILSCSFQYPGFRLANGASISPQGVVVNIDSEDDAPDNSMAATVEDNVHEFEAVVVLTVSDRGSISALFVASACDSAFTAQFPASSPTTISARGCMYIVVKKNTALDPEVVKTALTASPVVIAQLSGRLPNNERYDASRGWSLKKKMHAAGHMFHCLALEMRSLQCSNAIFSEDAINQWVLDRSAYLARATNFTNPWTYLISLGSDMVHKIVMEFLTHNSNIFSILADILISYARDCAVRYIKGLPGTGKTYSMAFSMIVLLTISEINILWTSAGNAAVDEASNVLSRMLTRTPRTTELRNQVLRLLAGGRNPEHFCDFSQSDRRSDRRIQLKSVRMVLCTTDMAKNELLKQSPVWAPGREVVFQLAILDEAQQSGDPSDLIVMDRLVKDALLIHMGDDRQPPMLVDPGNCKMVQWANYITNLELGISDPRIRFAPAIAMTQHHRQLCAATFSKIGPDAPVYGPDTAPSPIAVELQARIDVTVKNFTGVFSPVKTVAAATSRASSEMALLLAESRRSPPGMAALVSHIAYPETIVPTSQPLDSMLLGDRSDAAFSASWVLGRGAITEETPYCTHALRAGEGTHAIAQPTPTTFVQIAQAMQSAPSPTECPAWVPWGHPQRSEDCLVQHQVLNEIVWVCPVSLSPRVGAAASNRPRGRPPMVELLRGLIASIIALRHRVISTEHTIAVIVPYNNVVKELNQALLDSPAPGVKHEYKAMRDSHSELCSGDPYRVLRAITERPWIIQGFVKVCTAISSTGAQFLEVVYYKPAMTAFTEAFPANIVATTRCVARLWIVCNPARCRGLLSILAIYVAKLNNIHRVLIDGTPEQVLERIITAIRHAVVQASPILRGINAFADDPQWIFSYTSAVPAAASTQTDAPVMEESSSVIAGSAVSAKRHRAASHDS